ncbi:MAG: hypothetical protein HY870_01935 [Chloroflexi bacterium]|nr:hypothetical protein [Chloroflexota bacterium]
MPQLKPFLAGSGQINGDRLLLPNATRDRYSDAQVDNYGHRPTRSFPHRPPFRVSIQARFSSSSIIGTAGFGLWNHPFAPGGGLPGGPPVLPRALWFFYASPPSDMQLARDVPGHGWKAAAIDATRPSALVLAPFALPVVLLNRSQRLYRRIWPIVQRGLRIEETSLPLELLPDWHTYSIEWQIDRAVLSVDGRVVLETARPPRGRMGFVAWIDNQYAIVTPTGRLGFGLLNVPSPEWLELKTSEVALTSEG